MLTLRPYQTEALERVRDAYRAGKRRVLVSLPTGTGKTVVFAHFPRVFKMKKRLLVLAHREELLLQAEHKLRSVSPELMVGIEQAAARAAAGAHVVVASVPTLARNPTRLARLDPDEFSIVIVDEAHHAVAPSYRRIFDHFGLFESQSDRFLVGFTATPRRGDHQGLGDVFQEVCYARDMREMINDGFLAPVTGWRIDTDLSLDQVQRRRGEFVESQLARVVNTPERNALVIRAWRELAPGRRTIVFCVDVTHARDMHRAFSDAGIRAGAVWGNLPREERRAALERFSLGEIDVITNCNLLTEGFDEPRVDCVVMARPTQSKLLYAQMLGRGTRLHTDKSDLLVLDVVDNSSTHHLPGLHSLFDLPATMDLRGANALDMERQVTELNRRYPWIDTLRLRTPQDIPSAIHRIEFFNFDPPPELIDATELTWLSFPGGYRLPLPEGEWISVESNLLDAWEISHVRRREATRLGRERTLIRAVDHAERFVRETLPDARTLLQRSARWRGEPPTPKQAAMLARHGVPAPDGLTRGQASQMIALVMLSRR
jgi:superfamily II DNA or RNA helicase